MTKLDKRKSTMSNVSKNITIAAQSKNEEKKEGCC
jgi:hypothetical protein